MIGHEWPENSTYRVDFGTAGRRWDVDWDSGKAERYQLVSSYFRPGTALARARNSSNTLSTYLLCSKSKTTSVPVSQYQSSIGNYIAITGTPETKTRCPRRPVVRDVQDEVARWLACDDGDASKVTWEYRHEKAKRADACVAVRVTTP